MNDEPARKPQLPRQIPFHTRYRSPIDPPIDIDCPCPPTPPLTRSDSSDSTAMTTPSPKTPDFSYAGSPGLHPSQMFPAHKEHTTVYPALPQGSAPFPYTEPISVQQNPYFSRTHPHQQPAENYAIQTAAAAHAGPRSKKNSYPCPMAKQFGCNDYFTTSGHAARHAKKHTGKKDAFCPECNKAFTRKDNMEQHRRTHQSGRNAAKGTDDRTKKPKQQIKKPKPLQSNECAAAPFSMPVDPALPLGVPRRPSHSARAYELADAYSVEYSQRSPYPESHFRLQVHPVSIPSHSFGLDALAIAASGEKRKFEAS